MRLIKIGRDSACDIVLHSENVSSLHAEITLLNSGDIIIEDKGSRNGTFVMNQQIKPGKPVNIRRGDMVRFANVELQWGQIPLPEDNSAYKAIYGIGSHFNNEIQISGSTVSRYHATVKVGKDNKVYLIDHSKNGTTVDGVKIPSNTPCRIKKSSAISCGGVTVNLKNKVQWPVVLWKPFVAIAAAAVILGCLVFGVSKFWNPSGNGELDDKELFARYNNSVVMLMGIFHYEVSIGIENMDEINKTLAIVSNAKGTDYTIPKKVLWNSEKQVPIDISSISQKELIDIFDKSGTYTGTGFFISKEGHLITNLHIAKPWLYDILGKTSEGKEVSVSKLLENYYMSRLAGATEILNSVFGETKLSALISQLKVEGKLDYIALISNGENFDPDNITKCKVLSAGDDMNIDIALVQTVNKSLPTIKTSYVNVVDSMEISEDYLTVGERVYTIGFPAGTNSLLQNPDNENGMQSIGQGGNIIQKDSEFEFGYNAATVGGASGSPVFNKYGKLIGVHHAGLSRALTQGYNYAIKAKYVKELLEKPHKR